MCGSRQFLSERGPTITAFFLCLFLNDDERLDPDTTISGPSSVGQRTPFEWCQMAFRWRADAACPSLNARMITDFSGDPYHNC